MTSGTSRFAENHLILRVLTGPSAHLGTQAYNGCIAQKFLFPRFKQKLPRSGKACKPFQNLCEKEIVGKLKALNTIMGGGGLLIVIQGDPTVLYGKFSM